MLFTVNIIWFNTVSFMGDTIFWDDLIVKTINFFIEFWLNRTET